MREDDILKRAAARVEFEKRSKFNRLETYIPIANPQHVVIKRFARLYETLDDFHRGIQIHLLLAAPPRSTKTTTVFHTVVRKLTWQPKFLFGYGSYNVQIAREKSTDCRKMAARAGLWVSKERIVEEPETQFGMPSSTTFWQTPRGGGGKFTGRGGSAIGSGFGLIHIDDPVKNDEEAESETIMETNWAWMNGTMFTRRDPGGSIIVSHHRWSNDDPIGRLSESHRKGWATLSTEAQELLESVKWIYQEYPAVYGDGDPATDELFVPEDSATPGWRWFSRAELVFAKASNDHTWNGMWQQQPPRRGGKLFPERYPTWHSEIDESGEPVGLIVNGEWFPVPSLNGKALALTVDSAGSEEEAHGDMTAVSLMALWWTKLGQGYLLNADVLWMWFEQLESPDVVDYVAQLASSEHMRGVPIGYEDKGEGRAQLRYLKRDHKHLRVIPLKASQSKRVRSASCAGGARRGRLFMPPRTPENAEWLDLLLRQLVNFTGKQTGAGVDDGVDAVVHGWNMGLKLARPTSGAVGGRAIGAHMPRGKSILEPESSIIIPGSNMWAGLRGRR